jgi:nucleotide-binding universal stress UspA family protein
MTEQAPSADREPALAKADPAFTNVLCGIDDSRPSAEAARQAILLATPGGSIEFVAVCWTVGDGPHAMSSLNPQRAQRALEKAGHGAIEAGASAKWKIVNAADSAAALIEAAHGRDLAAVGSHAGSRALGIFFGSTASTLVHRAGAPVLVARRPRADEVQLRPRGSRDGSRAPAVRD